VSLDIDPRAIHHVHLIAIGGTGMGSLAGMFQAAGYHVTGSDLALYPPMSEQLAGLGIPVRVGFDAAHLTPRPDLVVIGNAISKGNPEGDAAIAQGIPYLSMADALRRFFFRGKTLAALCGTHGKTTSTALLAWLLECAGRDPTYLVGGVMQNTGGSSRVGQGALAVVEGDEYDTAWFDKVPKFVRYRPDWAVLANIEFDHADIYPDLNAVTDAFSQLVTGLPRDGLLVAGVDSANVRALLPLAGCEVRTFGLTADAELSGRVLSMSAERMEFEIREQGRARRRFVSPIVGEHSLLNILGVAVLAERCGLSDAEFRDGLRQFRGVQRRQQELGEAAGVLVLDDFAHHPTAVKATLNTLKAARPARRLCAVFEPRTNTSRRAFFQRDYALAFDAADWVLICDVQALSKGLPDDKLDVRRLVSDLQARGRAAHYAADYDAVLPMLADDLRAGDQVVFLSNGGFGNLPRRCLALLHEREAAP
jgi:UDP-N-acetylmuramate: L-alanyl-gamma-D-glutamyl-meso-diaminopimelate ligase